MKNMRRYLVLFLIMQGVVFVCSAFGQDEVRNLVPTHADAAVIFARHSKLFDRYVTQDATLNECVAFMNKQGIFFGLMEVVNGFEFTLKDCARVMGQIELVFTGEAEFVAGKVQLPKDIDSWKEFCILEGIEYERGFESVIEALYYAQQLSQ